eukprot:GHUV01004446.1.p1 GENE.GHUV01004446.1~~GHUV01004446.1.p1  ORF type:complete len:144 (+),score=47.69 GHUV01004446.1:100-531(+)
MTAPELERVDASTVASLVQQGAPDVAVVDVRNGEEFAAGHVKGALNLDSSAFSDTALVDRLVEQLAPKSQVVVHCAMSLQRGPAAAAKLRERLLQLGLDKQVVVMDGGFNKFSELYAADSTVVEAGASGKQVEVAAGDALKQG